VKIEGGVGGRRRKFRSEKIRNLDGTKWRTTEWSVWNLRIGNITSIAMKWWVVGGSEGFMDVLWG
jgi:hypothetical protein